MPLRDRLFSATEPLYLIDGSSYVYRGFYAFGDLSRSDGFPTNALLSVLRVVLKLLRDERPAHALFVLDGRGHNHRHGLFPSYKAQRDVMPEPLVLQLPPIMEGVALTGIPVLRKEATEADDIIASLAARFKHERPVVIVGIDKDLRQCLDRQVVLWDPSGKEEKLCTLPDFMRDFPPGPSRWPDFQALTGDASDNIPGVPGIGPKTAAAIMEDYPSLEDLKAGIEALKPAWRKKVEPHIEETFLYRELTRLRLDAADDVTLEAMAVKRAPQSELVRFLTAYEFRSLAREVPPDPAPGGQAGPAATGPSRNASGAKATKSPRNEQLSLFGAPSPAGAGAAPLPGEDALASARNSLTSLADLPSLAGLEAALVVLGPHGPSAPGLPDSGPLMSRVFDAGLPVGLADDLPEGGLPDDLADAGLPDDLAEAGLPDDQGEAGLRDDQADVGPAEGVPLSPLLPSFGSAEAGPPSPGLPALSPIEAALSTAERSRAEPPAACLPASLSGKLCVSLAVPGVEWFVAASPGELAQVLAQAASIATPSLRELLRSDPAWTAIALERWFDLSLAAYLLNPEERLYSWERLRDSLFTDPGYDPDEAPAHSQARACLALARRQRTRLAQAGLSPLLADLELPLVPVLVRMESAGIRIDAMAFAAFLREVEGDLARLAERMYEEAGVRFNLRSSQQLADVLYTRLGLKMPGKTPGGAASTSAGVLDKLAGTHPLVDSILEYRKLEKLRSTYLEPLPALADASGRIHTSFNQLATATGRLSSSTPNLQNIPVRGLLGKRMRSLFVAGPGQVLASADYSQIELRVLAHFSQDPTLLAAFRQGQDIHSRTAALLFDKPQAAVTGAERRQAKTINFGLLYGMGPQKLGRELGLSLNAAKEFITRYFERLSVLKDYYQLVVEQARAQGFVTTLAGRRRLLPDIRSRNTQLEAQARRQAINTVIQGSAADIIKMAMLQVDADPLLREFQARLILQVHDELVIEVPEPVGTVAGKRLAELMTHVVPLDVPILVDMGVSPDWAGAH